MIDDHSPRTMAASRIQIAQLMEPDHANTQGNVHGGWIMKLVDEAGALAAMRHAGHKIVTVVLDRMVFRQPIRIGDLVILEAMVTYAGRTSMEVEVDVVAENPISRKRTQTNAAFLVYVAIDDEGKPTQVPPLIAETPAEQARMDAAKARQQVRLAQKNT
jgi:acyl-CoA hydrolase